MKIQKSRMILAVSLILSLITPIFAQNAKKQIIFAVLNDGKWVEPIAFVEKGKLTSPVGGDSDAKEIAAFNKTYYKPGSLYRLIFGGANAGAATVVSSDSKSECSANMAQITAKSTKAKLSGFIMGLATNTATKKVGSGLRRRPTLAERTEIESLVRAEFKNQKVADGNLKNLRYHNLTALDVDSDKNADFVGSYWVETGATERALLFFIAEKNASGKYEFGYTNFRIIKQDEVMSGEIKSLDEGVYHELLLDVFDYDDDGVSEIFTYVQSFESSGFNAYKRENGKWVNVFEGSNYHCGY